MLKITTDGRKAALDLRLVDSTAQFTYQSKVARCVENVSGIYFRTKDDLLTQIIFCDISIPKNTFNIYDELKDRLAFQGIPKDEIAFIHEAETETKRAQLFEKVRKGEIRVLIGSTSKLGMGVNVQDKLVAIHHIDVPWRRADMTQREGRILRPGNTNKKIYIFRYITEGSFDAYSWQLLETKQHFISDLLSGSLSQSSGEEIESTILDYGEVKALAIGNHLVKKRVEAANELTRYVTLQRKAVENRLQMEQELLEIPGRVKNQKGLIESCNADIKAYAAWKEANSISEDNTSAKKEESERRRRIRERLGAALISHILEPRETFFEAYRGFEIILPANLTMEKPFIYLKKTGKYYLELGSSEIGHLIRIDNFLDSLGEHLASLKIALKKLQDRELDIKNELAKNENYIDKIEEYKQIVSDIDKKLGVSK
jgi:superfamily II DNA/RNA helicase